MDVSFKGKSRIQVRAHFLGERLEIRASSGWKRLGDAPLIVEAGDQGVAVLFRYGVVVLFDVPPLAEAALLKQIEPLVTRPFERPDQDEVEILFNTELPDRPRDGVLHLQAPTVERLQVVADVLAKSTVLTHYEEATGAAFDRVEPLAQDLAQGGRSRRKVKELLKHIGDALLVETTTIGRVQVTEKPEVLWENADLELLYARLTDEYELTERHVGLERKLAVVSRTAETLLGVLQQNSSHRVEWYIVILIVVELALMLAEMTMR